MRELLSVAALVFALGGCSRQVDLGAAPGVELDPSARFRQQLVGRWKGTARVFRAAIESEVAIEMTFEPSGAYTTVCTHAQTGGASTLCFLSFGDAGTLMDLTSRAPNEAVLVFQEQVSVEGEHIADATITWDPATLQAGGKELELWRVWEAPRAPVQRWFADQVEAWWTEALTRWLGEPATPAEPASDAGVDAGAAPDGSARLTAVAHVVLTRVP